MYHYVTPHEDGIAVSPEVFEAHLSRMSQKGYRGVSLEEAEQYLANKNPLPQKSVLLTFDDGFFDNYVYAWPLLRQYGHKAVIFAVAGKMEPEGELRPTLADYRAGHVGKAALDSVDNPFQEDELGYRKRVDNFINWSEARAMESSGAVAFAAHSMWHKSVFLSPLLGKKREMYKPGPRTRTFDRVDAPVVWGLPRFDVGPALSNRAFRPSQELLDVICRIVPQEKRAADEFFQAPDSEARVWKALESLPLARWGVLESEPAYYARVREELSMCRERIAEGLRRSAPRSLAWPWGEYQHEVLAIAKELGYKVFFATSFGPNRPGKNPAHVHRFKARNKSASWMLSRLRMYSRPWLAYFYAAIRI